MKNTDSKAGRSGIVVPHRPPWHGELAAWSVSALIKTTSRTWRVRFHDTSGMYGGRGDGPLIYAIWHNRLALSMTFWNRYIRPRRPAHGLAALISASKDGAILARTLAHFNVQAVRGSSSRRGAQSLLELKSAVENGYNVAITPDGPRGPKYTIHSGILALAQITQRPIIPVGARVSRRYTLKSWDGFQVPLPFSRCDLYIGQPLVVPPSASEEEKELIRGELKKRLFELNGE